MIWTNKMRHADGKSIQDQMVPLLTANPLWDSSFDLSWAGLTGISGNWASLAIPLYQQNAPCFVIPINLTTYTVTKVMEPITGTTVPGFRWGGCHGEGVSGCGAAVPRAPPMGRGPSTTLHGLAMHPVPTLILRSLPSLLMEELR